MRGLGHAGTLHSWSCTLVSWALLAPRTVARWHRCCWVGIMHVPGAHQPLADQARG